MSLGKECAMTGFVAHARLRSSAPPLHFSSNGQRVGGCSDPDTHCCASNKNIDSQGVEV